VPSRAFRHAKMGLGNIETIVHVFFSFLFGGASLSMYGLVLTTNSRIASLFVLTCETLALVPHYTLRSTRRSHRRERTVSGV
jgi:hypothetical protein